MTASVLGQPSLGAPLLLPFYTDFISAGFPSPATDYEEDQIDLNRELIAHPSSTYLVRASGDSMIGAGIYDKDLLVVDRSLKARDGSVVIAAVFGELTVKRLRIQATAYGKQMVLCAENPDYTDIPVQNEECTIWGVVRYAVRDLV